MQFVAAGGWQSSQREAVIKQLHGLSFGAFVSFVFADKDLNLLGKQAANRGVPPGGKDFGLAESRFTQTDRDLIVYGNRVP